MPVVQRAPFGLLPDGREASLFVLSGDDGFKVSVSDYGASLIALHCADRNGQIADVALGCINAAAQVRQTSYLGATIGRVAGRIGHGQLPMDGGMVQLSQNSVGHHLHGGQTGFSHHLWSTRVIDEDNAVEFTLISPDGDQGYPGRVEVNMTYRIVGSSAVSLEYRATADRRTPFNPMTHSYFNLNGHGAGDVGGHILKLFATHYTPTNAARLPVGTIAPVERRPFDFRNPAPLKQRISQLGTGFDHNFVIDQRDEGMNVAAILNAPETGRLLTIETDRPCIHLYTGEFLNVAEGKNGARYGPMSGLSLETQGFPDAYNHPTFPAEFLEPRRPFISQTLYHFDTKDGL